MAVEVEVVEVVVVVVVQPLPQEQVVMLHHRMHAC